MEQATLDMNSMADDYTKLKVEIMILICLNQFFKTETKIVFRSFFLRILTFDD